MSARIGIVRRLAPALAGVLLSACASYQPQPLPDVSPLLTTLPDVARGLAPADALDADQLAALAVRHNPDLRALRAELGIAEAQVFAAGLLPDPQLSASFDLPFHNQSGLFTAWGVGLAYDLVALLTRPATREAERAQALQVRLDLVWQEWQVAEQTQVAVLNVATAERRAALLDAMRADYALRYRRSSAALADGNLTFDITATDLTALLNTSTQLADAAQALASARIELNRLLGLVPDAVVPLRAPPACDLMDAAAIATALAAMPERRPDLQALRAGYASQEARLRGAILTQFPAVSLGPNAARDTGDVYTLGLGIGISLPIFNGNRGVVASERATRAALGEAYAARIATAASEVATVRARQAIVGRQRTQLAAHLPTLSRLVAQGRQAYAGGNLDPLVLLNMEQTWTDKRLEAIDLEAATCADQLGLEVLLAAPRALPGVLAETSPAALQP